jgi:hypothetical protein
LAGKSCKSTKYHGLDQPNIFKENQFTTLDLTRSNPLPVDLDQARLYKTSSKQLALTTIAQEQLPVSNLKPHANSWKYNHVHKTHGKL